MPFVDQKRSSAYNRTSSAVRPMPSEAHSPPTANRGPTASSGHYHPHIAGPQPQPQPQVQLRGAPPSSALESSPPPHPQYQQQQVPLRPTADHGQQSSSSPYPSDGYGLSQSQSRRLDSVGTGTGVGSHSTSRQRSGGWGSSPSPQSQHQFYDRGQQQRYQQQPPPQQQHQYMMGLPSSSSPSPEPGYRYDYQQQRPGPVSRNQVPSISPAPLQPVALGMPPEPSPHRYPATASWIRAGGGSPPLQSPSPQQGPVSSSPPSSRRGSAATSGATSPFGGISAALPGPPMSVLSPASNKMHVRTAADEAPRPPTGQQQQQQPQHQTQKFGTGMLIYEHESRNPQQAIRVYRCGKLLGQGAFAKVFEVTMLQTGEIFACKVVDKKKLTDENKRNKLLMEIRLHKRLQHPHVLRFIRDFQDDRYHYLVLERCMSHSLMEMSSSRHNNTFSLAETQYVLLQLLDGVGYLHSQNVIHRDLKLANVMIDAHLNMKVGDFGLATELAYAGQRKWTRCGTPNYIAPEVLAESEGYGIGCDTWSLGVIMYTLLVGVPPFQTSLLQTTYTRIQQGRYSYPHNSHVPATAKALIGRMLQCQPGKRPSFVEIRMDPFFHGAPKSFPQSLLRSLKPEDVDLMREAAAQPPPATPLDGFSPVQDHTSGGGCGSAPMPSSECRFESAPTPTIDSAMATPTAAFPSKHHMDPTNFAGGADNEGKREFEAHTPHSELAPPSFPSQPPTVLDTATSTTGGGKGKSTSPPPRPVLKAIAPSGQSGISGATQTEAEGSGGTTSGVEQPSAKATLPRPYSNLPAPRPFVPLPSAAPRQQPPVAGEGNQQTAISTTVGAGTGAGAGNIPFQAVQPPVYVTRMLDYSRKYGVGCELNDGSLAAVFNDRTKLLWRLQNGSVAYYVRTLKETHSPPTLSEDPRLEGGTIVTQQVDQLFDCFVVDDDGIPQAGGRATPLDRQTAKKMTLTNYFKTCMNGTELKERVAVFSVFPAANLDPEVASNQNHSNTRGGAAARGVYVKGVLTVEVRRPSSASTSSCGSTNSSRCNGVVGSMAAVASSVSSMTCQVISASTLLPTTCRHRHGVSKFHATVIRFSDGGVQVVWEPRSFDRCGRLVPATAASSSTASSIVSASTASDGDGDGQKSTNTTTTNTNNKFSSETLESLRELLSNGEMGLSVIFDDIALDEGIEVPAQVNDEELVQLIPSPTGRGTMSLSLIAPIVRCGEGHAAVSSNGPCTSAIQPPHFLQLQQSALWETVVLDGTESEQQSMMGFLQTLWLATNRVALAALQPPAPYHPPHPQPQ